jgi:hypothetical protein
MLGTILILILVLAILGALPRWPHSRGWGYYPTGGVGLILLIVVILLALGRIHRVEVESDKPRSRQKHGGLQVSNRLLSVY